MKEKFEVRSTPIFLKRIKVLDVEAQVRIIHEINILKRDPYAGKPLRGQWKGVYSLRIGDYRVLYQIRGEIILLLALGHRKRVYK